MKLRRITSALARRLRRVRAMVPVTVRGGPGDGLRMDVRRGSAWYADGKNELPVQNAMMSITAPGAVVFDIGANIGFFSLLAARAAGMGGAGGTGETGGRVFAFEPVPENAAAVRRNAALNDFAQIRVIEAAVAAEDGAADLALSAHPGGAVLASLGAPPDQSGAISVRTVSIDTLVESGELPPPTAVKIDVEGAESMVLDGMRRTLAAHRPAVICELDDATPDGLERKLEETAERFRALGYTVTRIDNAYAGGGWCVAHLLAR